MPPTHPPLARNRNYILLWTGQTLSELGTTASTVAFPLLVLAVSHSAVAAGLVGFANGTARFATGVLAGTLVDRWNRKKVMVVCEACRAVAFCGLVAAILTASASVPLIVLVSLVEGVFATLFAPAEQATLPRLVAEDQIAPAVAGITARAYLGATVGPALGGFLFGIARLLPFVADAASYVVSCVAVLFIRVPAQERTDRTPGSILPEVKAGLRWVWREPAIRVTLACAVGLNLVFAALYFLVIVIANLKGVRSGEIGVIVAMLGVGGLCGAFVAPRLQAKLGPYRAVAALSWLSVLLIPLIAVVPAGYWYGVLLAVMAFLTPTATTSVQAYQLLSTPDELRGRLVGAAQLLGGIAQALGPLFGGLLLSFGSVVAVLACAGLSLLLAVGVTASRTLRGLPR
jgi:MFS family permease